MKRSQLTYANVMSTAAMIVAVASAATSKPMRKFVKRLRKRARRMSKSQLQRAGDRKKS
jgi:hypothetical protein